MKKKLSNLVKVEEPCDKKWEEMVGNSHQRFCSVCEKNVYNISAMTNREAKRLIKDLNGNLCVRYVTTPQGKLITALPKPIQITRRATIAAGVLVASLSFSALIYGQTNPNNYSITPERSQQQLYTISGIIKDLQGNLVSNATITLKETKTGVTTSTESNTKGEYTFLQVPKSIYEIEIQTPGFENLNIKDIEISKNIKLDNILIKNKYYEFIYSETAGVLFGPITAQPITNLPKPFKKESKKSKATKKELKKN